MSRTADPTLALGATAALAAGCIVGLAGAAMGSLPLALGGGTLAGAGLVLLVAAGFVSGVLAVAVAAPLPAVYAVGDTRIAAVAPVAAGVLLAWAFRRGVERGSVRVGALPLRALVLLLAAFVLSAAFADDPLLSLRELLNFGVVAGFLVAATDELLERPEAAGLLVDALVVGAGLCGILAVLETVGIIPGQFPRWGTPFHRAALGFGQPNGLGLFLALLLPLAAYRVAVSRGPARAAALAALGAAGLGLVGTFSRGSWIAVLAGVAALVLAGETRLALRAMLVLAVGAAVIEVVSGGMLSDTVQRTIGDWVVEQRAALFLAAVQMFLAHPVLGIGPGGFADQVQRYAAQVTQLWDYQATPHNAYAQVAAETGIIGLVAFVTFFVVGLVVLVRAARAPAPPRERALRLALLSSYAALCVAAGGIWPFAHGTGEATMLVLALGFSRAAAERRVP